LSRPALHAALNATAALLLLLGWLAIRGRGPWGRGRSIEAHRGLMLGALLVSTVFLGSYLEYHSRVGSVAFWGAGWLRAVYLGILVPHTILAVAMLPPIAVTFALALRGRLDRHKAWARWTLPIWLWVSVSGVAVWFLNYGLRPDPS
jgi:putative membrane protein